VASQEGLSSMNLVSQSVSQSVSVCFDLETQHTETVNLCGHCFGVSTLTASTSGSCRNAIASNVTHDKGDLNTKSVLIYFWIVRRVIICRNDWAIQQSNQTVNNGTQKRQCCRNLNFGSHTRATVSETSNSSGNATASHFIQDNNRVPITLCMNLFLLCLK
jgi:hypothetical protein